jgi:hypothetical protein
VTYASFVNLYRFSAFASQTSQETGGRMWLKDEYTGNWTTLLIHILVTRYGNKRKSRDQTPAQEAIRLGSMLYLANVWRKYGVGPVRTHYLTEKLLQIHMEYDTDWQGCWEVCAWTLLMGVIETGGDMRIRFLDKLCELANAWMMPVQEIILQAKKVLWLNEAFPPIDAVLTAEAMDWATKRLL